MSAQDVDNAIAQIKEAAPTCDVINAADEAFISVKNDENINERMQQLIDALLNSSVEPAIPKPVKIVRRKSGRNFYGFAF